eukprot:m.240362 g.240362  ORF g.240362 m.240362 type:complete len:344 (-) comp13654_c0_seq1:116-1147(-)
MAVPHHDVQLDLLSDSLQDHATDLVLAAIPDWKREDVTVTKCTEGITNVILKFTHTSGDVRLVRIYGLKTENIIDRARELTNIRKFHDHALGPPLYATFSNGYLYGYFEGIACDPDHMMDADVYPLIAHKLAMVHKMPVAGHEGHASLLATVDSWLSKLPESFENPEKQRIFESLNVGSLRGEWTTLVEALTALNSPLVMCHNDLLCKNIIYNRATADQPSISFIDFEYAAPSFRGFDIGNHFCEFAGVDSVDYARYPGRELQFSWLREYLSAFKGVPTSAVTDEEILPLYREANKFALAAHFMWGTWAIIQAANSTIDFDYLSYSALRFGEYHRRCAEFLSL